jgi:uncharacterized protein (TIGR00288 family)
MSEKTVAIFVDYENIHISLEKQDKEFDPSKMGFFRDICKEYGELKKVVPVAYWPKFKGHEDALIEFGFQPFSVPKSKKNASDITLTVECMKSCFEDDCDTYIIFSGDGDFLPLINHLLNNGKEVYLYSVKGSTQQDVLIRLGKNKHFWIEEELSEYLREVAALSNNQINIIRSIYFGLKKMGFQSRGQLFRFVQKAKETYGELSDNEIGLLIDECIHFDLISEKEIPSGPKGKTRSLVINYQHPKVQKLNFISIHYGEIE